MNRIYFLILALLISAPALADKRALVRTATGQVEAIDNPANVKGDAKFDEDMASGALQWLPVPAGITTIEHVELDKGVVKVRAEKKAADEAKVANSEARRALMKEIKSATTIEQLRSVIQAMAEELGLAPEARAK